MQSKQVLEWQSEARAEGLLDGQAKGRLEQQKDSIIELLSIRFGNLPHELSAAIRSATNSARLGGVLVMAVRCASLDEFRREFGN